MRFVVRAESGSQRRCFRARQSGLFFDEIAESFLTRLQGEGGALSQNLLFPPLLGVLN